MRLSLDEIVSRVDDLPALPQIVAKVLKLTDDPNSTVKELSEVICQDQVLTAKVLRLANSAYYGYPRRIGSIVEAIVMLGFKVIRNLVMAASVQKILYQDVAGYRLEAGDLWRHSIACAMAAHRIAKRVGYHKSDEAFIAGLLHDIGKVVLSVYVNEVYGEIVKRVKEFHISFSQAEGDVLGFTHADVGARVVDRWNLPKPYVDAIAHHHEPELGKENHKLVAIVHLADILCMMMGIGLGGDGMYYAVSSEAFSVLELSSVDVENILEELGDLFIDTDAFDAV